MLRPDPRQLLAVPADDEGGPVKFLQHARRHDAHHADVPEQLAPPR